MTEPTTEQLDEMTRDADVMFWDAEEEVSESG